MKAWRTDLARLGYTLAGGSVSVVFAMWSRTLTLGGLHCFDAALVMLRLFHKSVSCSAFFEFVRCWKVSTSICGAYVYRSCPLLL